MNSNPILSNSIRFISLILAQVFIFDAINILGYISAYPYILFLLWYPLKQNRSVYIILAFILGITLDVCNSSGGIHAAACVTLAYIRPLLLRFAIGNPNDLQHIKYENTSSFERISYAFMGIIIHHFTLFCLAYFSVSAITNILKSTLYCSILTLILCILLTTLFSTKHKK